MTASTSLPPPHSNNVDARETAVLAQLNASHDAETCLELAAEAEGAPDIQRACLQRAVALDRFCQPALLNLAALALEDGDTLSTFGLLEEAARIAPLPDEAKSLRETLWAAAENDPQTEPYRRAIGRGTVAASSEPLSLLIIAATTTSAEWDLVAALAARGHRIKVLTSSGNAQAAADTGATDVLHSLLVDTDDPRRHTRDNAARIRTALTKSDAHALVVANLDGVDVAVLQPALERGLPVVHFMTAARASFTVDQQPLEPHYAIAPASDWTGTALRNAGYQTDHMDTVRPGVSMARHFRLFLPETDRLRICMTDAFAANSGADTLLHALETLQKDGVDFTAELTGEPADADALQRLRALIDELGLVARVRLFAGSDAPERVRTFARSNVNVIVQESPVACPAAQMEAMAAGVVVVASATGGTKEIIRDGTDGIHVRPGDATELATKLASLAQEPETFQRLQRAGQSRAASFPVLQAAEKLEKLINDLREERRVAEDVFATDADTVLE